MPELRSPRGEAEPRGIARRRNSCRGRWPVPRARSSRCIGVALCLLLGATGAGGQASPLVTPVPPGPWAAAEIGRLADGTAGGASQERFWRRVEELGTPVVERDPEDPASMLATFVVRAPRGPLSSVPAVHGTYGWHGLYRLENVPHSEIWLATIRFPAATRSAYWLAWPHGRSPHSDALDVFTVLADKSQPAQEVFADPLASRSAPYVSISTGNTGRYSWFEGPDAPAEPFLGLPSQGPRGKVESRVVASAILGNSRDVTVYLPPGYEPRGRRDYPLLLLFDRDEYLTTVQVPQLLDAMIESGAVPPLIAVLVDVIDHDTRNRELPGDPGFQRFIRHELLPQLERDFRITRDAARRVVGGVSYGALAATLLARRFPEAFGAVLSQSGAFWSASPAAGGGGADPPGRQNDIAHLFAGGTPRPPRFSISVGLLEGNQMVGPNRRLRDVLRAGGHPVDYTEFAGAHDWIAWRAAFPRQLIALLGAADRGR